MRSVEEAGLDPESRLSHLPEDDSRQIGHEVIPPVSVERSSAGTAPRHLLVCLDRSRAGNRLIRHAAALARAGSARVTVLHVLEGDPGSGALPPIDAVPGRLNETWFRAEETGTFYGQCSELCGFNHSYMPIVVEVVTQEDYDAWLTTQQASNDAAEPSKLAAAE